MGLSFVIFAIVKDNLFEGYLGLASIIIFISVISSTEKESDLLCVFLLSVT